MNVYLRSNAEELIAPFIEALREKKEVIGIVLLGGLGEKKRLDEYSDLDIAIFLEQHIKPSYLPPFSFHIDYNDHYFEFNVSQEILISSKEIEWDEARRAAYAVGRIVFDPKGVIGELLCKKLARVKTDDFNRLVTLTNQFQWRVNVHSLRAVWRGQPQTAHHLINEGIDLIIECIFLLNNTNQPHRKWQLLELDSQVWKPKEVVHILHQALLVHNFTLPEILRRINLLNKIMYDVKEKTYEVYPNFPLDTYKYWASHLSKRQLDEEPFADTVCRILKPYFEKCELDQIRGYVAYCLCDSIESLQNVIDHSKHIKLLTTSTLLKFRSIITNWPNDGSKHIG